MTELNLTKQDKVIIFIRILIQTIFLSYLVFKLEPFDIIAAYLIAIVSMEGYKILGLMATSRTLRYRELVGLITGVLNGIIFMITMYLTGYINSELWLFAIISIVLTAFDYGLYGAVAEGIVMSAMYFLAAGLSEFGLAVISGRSFVYLFISVIAGYTSNKAILFESRFSELEKRKELTREQRTRFVGVISHSLRTPLSTMRGYIDLLKNERAGKLSKKQKELVVKLYSESDELYDLVEDFITISAFESGRFEIKFEEFDVCKLCEEVYKEMTPFVKDKKINFKINIKTEKCIYEGERSKIENAIKNILDNAIKFTPPKGTVEFTAYQEADNIIVEVSDTGIGIPKEDQQDLFTMFKRGTNVLKYDYKGIGMGLYMSKMIVDAHGGRIDFESEEGVGSTFRLLLPIGRLGKVIRKLAR